MVKKSLERIDILRMPSRFECHEFGKSKNKDKASKKDKEFGLHDFNQLESMAFFRKAQCFRPPGTTEKRPDVFAGFAGFAPLPIFVEDQKAG